MVRKKKSSVKPQGLVHTKRRQVEDTDGWTHIIDTPKTKKATPKTPAFHGGDFEIGGVSYVNRTLEEIKDEFEHFKRAWEERPACHDLKSKLQDLNNIENIIILGLGSLQTSRREGRRTSATQLAALQTILEILREADGTTAAGDRKDLPVVLQDPQYTEIDKAFLSSLGYKVVDDPEAFKEVTEGSLVYAIHCYGPVYKSISEGPRPRVFIGTDIENFGRLGTDEELKVQLDEMVKDCQILDFPQVRHDFSDTKIYWRKESTFRA
ncbi:uncharacterized protein PAC_13034 [Phialocephala subalpina]|uniref:SRR1-like domain-containing protein n=1 Tax=Phialocephala subalpina TaxID=576137 RepID=A0A1L7XDU3_9HELO|nr:uncharacterized protein PAC_13034 [Phialocephala subalpina]